MARNTKLTDETQAKFSEGIRLGMTYKLAAAYCGISEAVVYKWKREAEAGHERQMEFVKAIKGAEGVNAAKALACIERAAQDGSWQAAAWILERRHEYRRESVIIEPQVDLEEVVDPTTKEGREAILEELANLPQDLILAALNRRNMA
tara:strand:+ start:1208 stop:1651 length:444 start_codon:yes stop_codon:yes gene_type:complete